MATRGTHTDVELVDHGTWIELSWHARGDTHQLRLDRVPNTHPRLIGSAAALDGTGDRRGIPRVIEVLTDFGSGGGESVALFHDDGRLEWLVEA